MKGKTGFVLLCFAASVPAVAHTTVKGNPHARILSPADTTKNATDTTDDKVVKHRIFEIGLEGASDQAHYGLYDKSVKLPYLDPSFTYIAKSGFFMEVDAQYLLLKKPKGGFDVFRINPGWDIDLAENTTLDFNYTHYFFKKKTPQLIRSGLNNALETYLEQDIGDFTGKLSIDYDIYTTQKNKPKTPNDFIISPEASYDFEIDFAKKSSITFTPEASVDFGTRNFYTQYIYNKDTTLTKKNYTPPAGNSSFGTLDYNFSLTVEYAIGKFSISPCVTVTHSLYNSGSTSSNPTLWYGNVTLTYKIKSKK